MGKNNKQGQRQSQGAGTKNNHQNNGALRLTAFTDASVSEAGEATAAIILMNVRQNFIYSAHVMNMGFNLTSNQAEMAAMITALGVAPAGTLEKIVCDNIGAVESLRKHRYRGTSKQTRLLSDADMDALDDGISRHRRVIFERVPRSDNNIRLADKFSRLARGMEPGVKSARPLDGLRLFDQKQQIGRAHV